MKLALRRSRVAAAAACQKPLEKIAVSIARAVRPLALHFRFTSFAGFDQCR
jgi:hypothetical protein